LQRPASALDARLVDELIAQQRRTRRAVWLVGVAALLLLAALLALQLAPYWHR